MASLLAGNKTSSVKAMAALGAGLSDAQKKQFDTLSKKPFRDQVRACMLGSACYFVLSVF